MPSLSFKGVAHPPARADGKRDHNADLSSAEISTTNLGRRGGTEEQHGDDPPWRHHAAGAETDVAAALTTLGHYCYTVLVSTS